MIQEFNKYGILSVKDVFRLRELLEKVEKRAIFIHFVDSDKIEYFKKFVTVDDKKELNEVLWTMMRIGKLVSIVVEDHGKLNVQSADGE